MLTTKGRAGAVAASVAVVLCGYLLSAGPDPAARGKPVPPGKVVATYACKGQQGRVELTATRLGRRGTVEVRLPRFKAPVPLLPGVVRTRLTLARRGGGSVTFSGSDNPAIGRGQPVRSGPLSGTVARGDRLYAAVGERVLSARAFGREVRCSAVSAQRPGAFAF